VAHIGLGAAAAAGDRTGAAEAVPNQTVTAAAQAAAKDSALILMMDTSDD
jgi:hypothetical protein